MKKEELVVVINPTIRDLRDLGKKLTDLAQTMERTLNSQTADGTNTSSLNGLEELIKSPAFSVSQRTQFRLASKAFYANAQLNHKTELAAKKAHIASLNPFRKNKTVKTESAESSTDINALEMLEK